MSIYIKLQSLCVCIVLCVTGTYKASVQIGGYIDDHRCSSMGPRCSSMVGMFKIPASVDIGGLTDVIDGLRWTHR